MFAHQYELKGNNPNIFKYTSHSEERNKPTANKTKCIFFEERWLLRGLRFISVLSEAL